MNKLVAWIIAIVLLAAIASGVAWWMGTRSTTDMVEPQPTPGPALPAAVDYEFVWPDGAARGTDVPREILIPSTGQRLPLIGLGDLSSEPGEDKVAFLQRVRQAMVEFSTRQSYEACGLICSDGNGTYSVRMTTVNAVAHCAIAPICLRGHVTMQQSIHSHCPNDRQYRATFADEVLSGRGMRRNSYFGRCDSDNFSSTDFNGWKPGWLAAPSALYRHDGPGRITRFE